MKNEQLQGAMTSFIRLYERVSKDGVGLNIKQLKDDLAQGIDALSEALNTFELPSMRAIRQIAATESRLYALCEDGTMWVVSSDWHWTQVQSIPPKESKP